MTEYIKEANDCIDELNKSHKIVIVDEDGNETNLFLKCLIPSEDDIIYGWCESRTE